MPVPLRILVTRPQPSATATAARLEAMGHEAIVLPVMQAAYRQQALADALAQPHGALAVTSAEAIRALAASGVDLSRHLETPVFCVGAATAAAASGLGFRTVLAGSGDGADLARLISRSLASKTQNTTLLYLAGIPRSPGFEIGLKQAGIACVVAEIYRMTPIAYPPGDIRDLLQAKRPDAILFYSRETAKTFFSLLDPETLRAAQNIRFFCLSDHVAGAVPAAFASIAIAAEPNEDSLLSLL